MTENTRSNALLESWTTKTSRRAMKFGVVKLHQTTWEDKILSSLTFSFTSSIVVVDGIDLIGVNAF